MLAGHRVSKAQELLKEAIEAPDLKYKRTPSKSPREMRKSPKSPRGDFPGLGQTKLPVSSSSMRKGGDESATLESAANRWKTVRGESDRPTSQRFKNASLQSNGYGFTDANQ